MTPAPETPGWVRPWVALRRVLATLGAIAGGLHQVYFALPKLDSDARRERVRAWSARVLRGLDVGVQLRGAPADGVLLVANHVSWLDITALHAVAPGIRFVSKSTIARWPLVRFDAPYAHWRDVFQRLPRWQ